jgi:hypothetical protein
LVGVRSRKSFWQLVVRPRRRPVLRVRALIEIFMGGEGA